MKKVTTKVTLNMHYEKLCLRKPHYLVCRVQKPFKYNYVATTSSKVQFYAITFYEYDDLINKFAHQLHFIFLKVVL